MMSVLAEKAIVKEEELWDVVETNQWKINNSLDEKYNPRSCHVIVREAKALVGQELPYCVFRGNCEHFANELRYGKAESRQVSGSTTKPPITFKERTEKIGCLIKIRLSRAYN